MAEQVGKEFQSKVEAMVDRVSNAMLPVQRKGAECALRCFDTHKGQYKEVGRCVENCQKPFAEVGEFTNRQFQQLQNSVQACAQVCSSRIGPKFEAARGDLDQQQKIQKEHDECIVRCFKDAEPQLTEVEARILNRGKQL